MNIGTTPSNEVEHLECGTSLVEKEYSNTTPALPILEDNNNNSKNEEEKLESLTSNRISSNNYLRQLEHTFANDANDVKCIESLRSYIASDILQGDNKLITTFASPFEDASNIVIKKNRSATITNSISTNKIYYQLPLIYCDQTASNRAVYSIEQYLQNVCLPLYGNTHTNTSITGSQSTAFIAEARQIIAEETNAKITGKASTDIILFTGSGATSAVELLIDCLGIRQMKSSFETNPTQRPVVFIGPYEHHSNLIPWRESGCEIVMIPENNETGTVDFTYLESVLQQSQYNGRMKMGAFTAASNVTGKVTDLPKLAKLLHQNDTYCFIDSATAAPYCKIDMNPIDTTACIDATFISVHKMMGGINTPGILIIKKHLVSQSLPPSRSGGGTVFYVTNTHHRFLSNRIERYEGGTPNIIGIARAGLVFLFKRQIEQKYLQLVTQQQQPVASSTTTNSSNLSYDTIPPTILEYEFSTYKYVASYLRQNAPNLVLLGSTDDNTENQSNHLPIFSFLIKFKNRFLHYNYVCAILNDVFGIQSRGGCQCAGPYSQRLLGLTEILRSSSGVCSERPNNYNERIENALLKHKERAELLRPGYTRLSLPYKGLSNEIVQYVVQALVWVSNHGWSLMCQYRCNHRTGEWRHSNRQGKPLGRIGERKWLSHYNIFSKDYNKNTSTILTSGAKIEGNDKDLTTILQQTLSYADTIREQAKLDHKSIIETSKMVDSNRILGSDDDIELEALRWYVYPKECATILLANSEAVHDNMDQDKILGAINPNATLVSISTQSEASKKHTVQSLHNVVEDSDVQNDSGKKRNASLLESTSDAGADMGSDKHVPDTATSIPMETTGSQSVRPDAKTDTTVQNVSKRQKKESRDSSTWGQPDVSVTSNLNTICIKSTTPAPKEVDDNQNDTKKSKKGSKFIHERPPPKIMRLATQAVMQWDMIKEGDRLLLGLSGGKDSLSLLHCLLEFKRILPVKFEIEVCTIDPLTPSFDPSPLIPYVESLGLKYHYIRDNIVDRANNSGKDGKMVASLCAFCARMKRGNLYSCARKNNCNKLVLAQHLDDCAESFMMSFMHNGFLRTMKAHYMIDSGDLAVIRPLIYCRESLMTDFAKSKGLPVINENCPACFEEPKERARIKKLLSREETMHPNFYDSIKRSLIPLMHDDMAPILRGYTEEIVSKSRTTHKVSSKKVQEKSESEDKCRSISPTSETGNMTADQLLSSLSDDVLVLELARRKAIRSREIKAENDKDPSSDPTGQFCTLNGGNGSIPCRELME